MPRGKGQGSETPTNDPTPAGGAAQGGPAPTPSGTQTTFDLNRYRTEAAEPAAPSTTGQPGRERGPKVKFKELAGLDGFHAKDPFDGHDPQFGHWAAVTIVAPDGATATAISNVESGPGAAIMSAVKDGTFDNDAVVPVRVRLKDSINKDPETGKPYVRVLVTFG